MRETPETPGTVEEIRRVDRNAPGYLSSKRLTFSRSNLAMRKTLQILVVAGLWCSLGCGGPGGSGKVTVRTKTIELGPLHLDRIYHSMEGPSQRTRFDMSDVELLTGFSTRVVDITTGEKMGDEFFCHSQLQLDNNTRLLVNATGIDVIRFPDGFGMPIQQILKGVPESGREVSLLGMVLNNHEENIDRLTKLEVTLEYLTADDWQKSPGMKKLFKVGIPVMVQQEGSAGMHHDMGDVQMVEDLPAHWVVPPGRQVQQKKYSDVLPVDATVHYIAVHMHNYGVSMRLTDLTENKVLWQTNVVNESNRVQIQEIPVYRSVTGFPMYRDHEYEVEAVYDNSSDRPVDAMAVMYIFYHPVGDENITYPQS